MRIRALVLAAALDSGAARRTGRRPRGVVGGGILRRGGRGGQGDHRRLRAGDRQTGRAGLPAETAEIADKLLAAHRGRPAARLRFRPTPPPLFGNGPSTIGWWISRTPVGRFSNLFDPDTLALGRRCSTRRRAGRRCTGCRSGARPTTSTSGRASWSRRVSPSRTFRKNGTPSGRSGAIRCSRPYAGHGPRRHLGHRPYHVGRRVGHRTAILPVRGTPTRRIT